MKINTKSKKIIYLAGILLPVIIILVLSKPLVNRTVKNTNTTPLINTIEEVRKLDISSSTTKDIYNNLIQNQKINFNWNNTVNLLPEKIKNYSLNKTIINSIDINNLISQLNFYETDKQEVLLDQSITWFNNRGSLFISPSLNHLSYYYRTPIPQDKISSSEDQLIKKSREILSRLIGNEITSTLDEKPTLTYLYKDEKQGDEGAEKVEQNFANIVSISYKQKIDNLPVVTTSNETNIITVALDSKEKLYTLYINGGYSQITSSNEIKLPSLEEIKSLSNDNVFLINSLDSLSMDKWYRDNKQIFIENLNISAGYYTGNEYNITPVIVIEGIIKNPINGQQKVVYALPIKNPTPESL